MKAVFLKFFRAASSSYISEHLRKIDNGMSEINENATEATPQETKRPAVRRGHVDLLNSPFIPSLTKFAIPMTFSFLVNMVYSLIDRWFISHMGTDAIAAIGLGEQIGFLVFTLGSGFCMGTGVIVARRFGERDSEGADRTATQAIVFMLTTTIILSVLLQLALPMILGRFGASPTVALYAQQYLTAIFLGFAGNLLTFQINAIVRSTGMLCIRWLSWYQLRSSTRFLLRSSFSSLTRECTVLDSQLLSHS